MITPRKNQNCSKKTGGVLFLILLLFFMLQTGILLVCRFTVPSGTRTHSSFSRFCRDLHTPARPERPGEQLEVRVRLLVSCAGFRRGQNDRFSGDSALLPELLPIFDRSDRISHFNGSSLMNSSGIFTNHPARAAPVFSCRI